MWREVAPEEVKLLQLEKMKKRRKRQTINWSVFKYWTWITALYAPKVEQEEQGNGEENEILKYAGRWSIENTVHKYILLLTGESHLDYLREMEAKDRRLWRKFWRNYVALCSRNVTLANLDKLF